MVKFYFFCCTENSFFEVYFYIKSQIVAALRGIRVMSAAKAKTAKAAEKRIENIV